MKVAIIADTHDNLRAVSYLTGAFNAGGIEALIHAGDFISPFVVPALDQFKGEVHGAFGNNDGDRKTLLSQSEGTDVSITEPPLQVELGGLTFAITHTPDQLAEANLDVDCHVHGHTHEPEVTRTDDVLKINPGEAGGWLTGTTHFALIDTENKQVRIRTVPAP